VSVIGNGKLKYNVERTHCNKPKPIKGKRLSKIYYSLRLITKQIL